MIYFFLLGQPLHNHQTVCKEQGEVSKRASFYDGNGNGDYDYYADGGEEHRDELFMLVLIQYW